MEEALNLSSDRLLDDDDDDDDDDTRVLDCVYMFSVKCCIYNLYTTTLL